ncbi:MAG TPA: hypothetical protein PKG71_00300 [Candidatus Woesebacteria bacterium]|nr:hypothetical protein [Candidatus Woesebacteria bacterium]HNS94398.1 hypothetical protein [Candidatus Woesebacteria bacterium]
MKITISNKVAIVLANVLQISFVIKFFGLFIIAFFVLGLAGVFDKVSAIVGWLIVLLPSFLYLAYIVADSLTYASHATIELKENSVDVHFKNLLKQGDVSLPVSQIESTNLSQSFFFRLLGIGVVSFIQESGVITISWGYNYNDAKAFLTEFGNRYKVKIG